MHKFARTALATIAVAAVSGGGVASGQGSVPEPSDPTAAPESSGPASVPASTVTAALPEPPGELFDVDGHDMHLYCTGNGSPTVVLDTGLGDSSVNVWPLQEDIAEFTRVCSYDRAGYGWSEPGPEPRTSQQIVDELVALLDAAGEQGPFVLAGHSFGGLDMILFGATHPDLVDGVVLIDSSHPEQLDALAEVPEMLAAQDAEIAGLESLATAAAAGEVAADDVLAAAPDLPPDQQQVWAELFVQPTSLQTAVAEYESLPASAEQVAANGSLGDIPLVVLARGLSLGEELPPEALEAFGLTPEAVERFDTIWRGLQEDHVTRSTNGTLVVADDSGHYVYRSQPELVVEQIRSLIESGA